MKPALVPIVGSSSLQLFAQCSMDCITGLPPSPDGHDAIMVVVDHGLMKGIVLILTSEKGLTAEKTAELFIVFVYKCFGIPDKLISDCGPQFDSAFFQAFCKALGILDLLHFQSI